MFRGFALSTLLHAGILAAAMVSFPAQESECDRKIRELEASEPNLDPIDILLRLPECAAAIDIPIDVIEIGDTTDIAPIVRREETPETEDEQVLEEQPEDTDADPALEDDPAEDDPVPDKAVPEDTEEPEVTLDETTEKEEEAEEADTPPEEEEDAPLIEKTQEAPEDDFDSLLSDFESVLEDKANEQPRARPKVETPTQAPVLTDTRTPRRGAGEGKKNTASLQAAVRRQVLVCWRGVADLPREDQIDVVIGLELDRDGNLAKPAKLQTPRSRPIGRAGIPVDYALRAVRKCAPYQLPEDDYDDWKNIQVTIGPAR